MPTMNVYTFLEVNLGTELKRIERVATRTLNETVLDRQVNLEDGNIGLSQATLFDAAVDTLFAGWLLGVLIVDPQNLYPDDSAIPIIAVDFVGDAVSTPAIQVRREFPLVFGSSGAGGPAGGGLATIDGAITQIRARNNNAAPGSGNSDVKVRLTLFK